MKLFGAKWCSQCTPVKQYVEANNLVVEYIDVDTEEGGAAALKLGVRGLPVLTDGVITLVGDKVLPYLKGL